MKPKDGTDKRISMFVESPRGDDKMGTNANTGSLISDHEASEKGVPFEVGVPKEKIQWAIEKQLKDDKWVVIEKKDGSSELLTKGDIPQPEVKREEVVHEKKPGEKTDTGNAEALGKAAEDDWRKVFSAVTVKPRTEPKQEPKSDEDAVKPSMTPTVKPACTAVPKKEKETWTGKFENIKSATATHKGKGG
jgi:hypothetical protein